MPCHESWIYFYDQETKRESSQGKHVGSPRPKKARQIKSTSKLLMFPFFDITGMMYMHCVPTGQTVNKEMKEAVTKVIDMLTQEDFPVAFHKLL